MAINVPSGLHISAQQAVDDRILLTKAQMLSLDEGNMPDVYYAVCKDDGQMYIFNKTNTVDATTGKFRVLEGGSAGAGAFIVEATITSDTAFTTTDKPSELLAAYNAGKNLYLKATNSATPNQIIVTPITSVKTTNGVAVATFIDGVTNKEFTLSKPTSDDAYVGVIATKTITGTAPLEITDGSVELLYDDKTIKVDSDTNKLYAVEMTGATETVDGKAGLVPKPGKADFDNFLKGDGTWETLPQAMHFKGSLGIDGTAEMLPDPAPSNEGDTYKVITAAPYQGKEYSVGDLAVSNGGAWVRIPSGDVPTGTVTNIVAYKGLTTEDGNPITSTGKIGLDIDGAEAGSILVARESGSEIEPSWEKNYIKVSETGASTAEVNYITVNGAEYKIGGTGTGPAEYLKKIEKDDTSFTITDQDDVTTKVEFSETGTSTNKVKYVKIGNSELKLGADEVAVMGGASATTDGASGLVPQPLTTDRNKFLKGDGSWSTISGGPTAYIKDASVGGSGNTNIVLTRQDDNTVEFDINGVSDVGSGATDGTIKVRWKDGTVDESIPVTGLQAAAYKDVDSAVTAGSYNLVTSDAIRAAIDELPQAMHFKGSLGTSGTITDLPAAATDNEGDTYRVITAGTYASTAYLVGDLAISNGTIWVRIPSSDVPTGTVMSVKAGNGLKTASGVNPITASGELQIDAEGIEAGKVMTAVGDGTVTWEDAVEEYVASAETYTPGASETRTLNGVKFVDQDGTEIKYYPNFSKVTASSTGSATDSIQYITIDGVEYLLAGGGNSAIPEQAGHDGQFLMTNGTNPSWQSMPKIYYQAEQPSSGVADKYLWAKKSSIVHTYYNGTRVDSDVVKFYKSVLGLLLIRDDGIHDQTTSTEVITPWNEITDTQIAGYISSSWIQECAWNEVPTFGKHGGNGYNVIANFSQVAAPAQLYIYNGTTSAWEAIGSGSNLGYDDSTIGKNGLDNLFVKDGGISYDKLDAALKAQLATNAFQVTTLPTAEASEVGKIYQYIGPTNAGADMYFGYFYTCIEDTTVTPSMYSFQNINVQEGGESLSAYDDITINLNDDDELQVKNGGLNSTKMSADFLKLSDSAMVASDDESDITIHSSKAVAAAIEGFNLDALYYDNDAQTLKIDYYLPFNSEKQTLEVGNMVNVNAEQSIYNKDINTEFNTISNIKKDNFSSDAIAEVVHSVGEASDNKFVLESAVAGVLEGSNIQYTTLPTASATTLNRVVQYIGETTTTAPLLTKGHFYVCVAGTGVAYSWQELQVQTVYDATDSTNGTIALSANQGHVLFGLLSAMAGVVKVKVVVTQPEDTAAERNTIYYIGTAAPYTVKLFTKNEDEGPKWTDLGTTDIALDDYVNKHTDIVDNLTSEEVEKPLSAKQGKVLSTMVGNKQSKVTYSSTAPTTPTLGDIWVSENYMYYYTEVPGEGGGTESKWVKVAAGSHGIYPVMELPTEDISTTSFYKVEYCTVGYLYYQGQARDGYILEEDGLYTDEETPQFIISLDDIGSQWESSALIRGYFRADPGGYLLIYRRRNDNTTYAVFKNPEPNDAFRIYLYNYDTSSWMVVLDSECQAPYAQVNVEEWGAATRNLLLNKMSASVRGLMTFSSVKFASTSESPDGKTSTKFTVTVTKEDGTNATFMALTTSGKCYVCGYVNAVLGKWAQLRRTDDGWFDVDITMKKAYPVLTMTASNTTSQGNYRADIYFRDRNNNSTACIRANAEDAFQIGRVGQVGTEWYNGGLMQLYKTGGAQLRAKAWNSDQTTLLYSVLDLNSNGTFNLRANPSLNTSSIVSDTYGSIGVYANGIADNRQAGLLCNANGGAAKLWGNVSSTKYGYVQISDDGTSELYNKSGDNAHKFKNKSTGVDTFTLDGKIKLGLTSATGDNILAQNQSDKAVLWLEGGPDWNKGAKLLLNGQNNDNHGGKGSFLLSAQTSSAGSNLIGKPDGTLTWRDYQVMTVNNTNKAAWSIPVANGTSGIIPQVWKTPKEFFYQVPFKMTRITTMHGKVDKGSYYYVRFGKMVLVSLTMYVGKKSISDGATLCTGLPTNNTGGTVGGVLNGGISHSARIEMYNGSTQITLRCDLNDLRWWQGQFWYFTNDPLT